MGGIKEKVLAAHRAGIKTIILPAANERDLVEVPDKVKGKLNFKFAERMDQVAQWAFAPTPKKKRKKEAAKKAARPAALKKAAKGKK